eukprot:jgi/Tetstr1/422730/TSEL_013527.t1
MRSRHKNSGRSICTPGETVYMHVDSSGYGWGAVLNEITKARGFSYNGNLELHITYKELKANVRSPFEASLRPRRLPARARRQTQLKRRDFRSLVDRMDAVPGAGAVPYVFTPQSTQSLVLCCLCGVQTQPNPSNMCINCIKSQVDITEGIQKQVSVLWCKECNRYLQPPKHWMRADLESKELLTFCIKRTKGLQKVKLVDAAFIWTEPHSRRLKTKLTVQKEVLNGAILQQTFQVEYVVEPLMCLDCNRANANPNSWTACVQVRQHVPHKRTFFYLEQLIIRHGADEQCLKIKDIHEGVDFYMANRAHGSKFVDFLQSVVPIRYRHDKQLVSHNEHENNYNYKYTFSVEIAPICKDDLVCLPSKVCKENGNVGPVLLCIRVTAALLFMDPTTLRTYQVDSNTFFRQPYRPLTNAKQLVEYVVLDIEPLGPETNKWALAEAQVARASDFGVNDKMYMTKTHLGHILHPGDMAWGYDVANLNVCDPEMIKFMDTKAGAQVPEVVLVKKSYEEKRKQRRARGHRRAWMLKRMDMEVDDETMKASKARAMAEQAAEEQERFMQELEEDPELRKNVALFKDPSYDPVAAANAKQEDMGDDDDSDGDVPEVPIEELLDGLDALGIEEGEDSGSDDMLED